MSTFWLYKQLHCWCLKGLTWIQFHSLFLLSTYYINQTFLYSLFTNHLTSYKLIMSKKWIISIYQCMKLRMYLTCDSLSSDSIIQYVLSLLIRIRPRVKQIYITANSTSTPQNLIVLKRHGLLINKAYHNSLEKKYPCGWCYSDYWRYFLPNGITFRATILIREGDLSEESSWKPKRWKLGMRKY